MFTLIFAEIIQGFKRIWKLYLTNILSILFIILLFAYIDGSRRQLNLQKTAFSGEVVVKMNEDYADTEQILKDNIPSITYITNKIRAQVQYRLPSNKNTGMVELIGVDLESDKNLINYLTLREGRTLQETKDILIPTSIWQKTDINVGDIVLIIGKNAQKVYNTAPFKVCGFYNSASLTIFSIPRFLITTEAMQNFYMPKTVDIEYCLYFEDGKIPPMLNKDIRTAFDDKDRTKVKAIEYMQVSSLDVMNISVQMGVFLYLIISLTIIVVVTVVILVNFNIYMILFRKSQKQFGTLMAFGVPAWKISLTLLLKSFFQIVFSTMFAVILALAISSLASQQLAGGFIEVIFVLLSGTNRIDFFIQPGQINTAFWIIMAAVAVAQIPIFFKVILSHPIEVISGR